MFPVLSPRSGRALRAVGFATLGVFLLALAPGAHAKTGYLKRNLVSDLAGVAAHQDANLVNPWGIAFSPTHPFWVADNGTSKATLYNGDGVAQPLVVDVAGAGGAGRPTGQVFNGSSDFNGDLFLYASEDGTISGWKNGTTTQVEVDKSDDDAIYKGLALAETASGRRLYAADFHNGVIDVFDATFQPVTAAGQFVDPHLPDGYAPFNIHLIGSRLYVLYAKQDDEAEDEVGGTGFGLISVFDTSGHFLKRLVTGTDAGGKSKQLNAPWGLAKAPSNFGPLSGALLVGNFGSGRIAAFSSKNGHFIGYLRDRKNKTITIEGLWEIVFGAGGDTGSPRKLYFSAGIDQEAHGLFGSIEVAKGKSSGGGGGGGPY